MAAFNIVTEIPGVDHHTAHMATAAIVTGAIVVGSLFGRAALGKGEKAVQPAGKISVKGFLESIMDFMVWITELILGKEGFKYIPLFGSIFLYILINNLMGLIPGFAPATENINTGLAVGIFSFLFYNYIGFKSNGIGYLKHFAGPFWWLAPLIFAIEMISHIMRPFTLGLRLSANMTGDHAVLGTFLDLTKLVVPVVFYFFGTFVSLIQAFVFTLLSMVYVSMAMHHD